MRYYLLSYYNVHNTLVSYYIMYIILSCYSIIILQYMYITFSHITFSVSCILSYHVTFLIMLWCVHITFSHIIFPEPIPYWCRWSQARWSSCHRRAARPPPLTTPLVGASGWAGNWLGHPGGKPWAGSSDNRIKFNKPKMCQDILGGGEPWAGSSDNRIQSNKHRIHTEIWGRALGW